MRLRLHAALLACPRPSPAPLPAPLASHAQWQLQDAHTTADFRGIQALDNNTAIVMSSGKGDLSRFYKPPMAAKPGSSSSPNPTKTASGTHFR